MEERAACTLLKQRFEAAGFTIEDNRPFDEDGIRFEIDGFDAQHRVGYEYVTEEAGDSWDVDDAVIAALEERRKRGEIHILIVREADAPDAESLGMAADAFLTELRERGVGATAELREAGSARAKPASTQSEPAHGEPAPTQAEPAHTEPAHAEPAPSQIGPAHAEPAPTHAEQAHAEPAPSQIEPAHAEPPQAEVAGSSEKPRAKSRSEGGKAKASKGKTPAKPKAAKKKSPRK